MRVDHQTYGLLPVLETCAQRSPSVVSWAGLRHEQSARHDVMTHHGTDLLGGQSIDGFTIAFGQDFARAEVAMR